MKEILIHNVPSGATVLVAHEPKNAETKIPDTYIIEMFNHIDGPLYLQYGNYQKMIIRIRSFLWRPLEIKTVDIRPNLIFETFMVPDN